MAAKRIREACSSSPSTPALKKIREDSCNSSLTRQWNYDLFLSFSFRGEDNFKNFTDNLYTALVQKGLNTFRDDDQLKRGEDFSSQLPIRAIELSRISIIVFSCNYASSTRCLDGLAKILQCKKMIGQTVLPVFYNVDPSDVRKQGGSFAKAFASHEERFKEEIQKVKNWRAALSEAGNLSGWHLQNVSNGRESEIIQRIIEEVFIKLKQTPLNVSVYQVGIDSRVHDINILLNVGSDDICIVGICGMGGIGKTTIAKAVYNLIFHKFDGSSFLANVGEISKQHNGLVLLQNQLLFDVLSPEEVTISNNDRGLTVIRQRLHDKRVLIVLDDVDHLDQLNALVGNRDWFGLGSKIIITTRDVDLLNVSIVDATYMVEALHHFESLQLFSWHAFRKSHPIEDFVKLSNAIVRCVGGLPLALEVLGSFLFDKRRIWKSELEKLKRIPNDRILDKLKISYDALDHNQKVVFLDIAFFLSGMEIDYAIKILDACGLFPETEIRVLVHRSLVTIIGDKLRMHDLLRDVGREVVWQESPKEPGERSRLWFHEDVHDVLTKNTGTKKVQGVALNLPGLEGVPLTIEAFAKMENLRLLQVNNVQLTGGYEHLFKDHFPFWRGKNLLKNLRWLCWHRFNLEYIPINFHLENLVILDMRYSSIRKVGKAIKFLEQLKVLDLSHSHYLTRTPDFEGLSSLERLMLEDCRNLTKVHQSIGHLKNLVFLNLKDCRNLYSLPRSICALKFLKILILSGCSILEELPEDLGNMEGLIELLADGTAIKQLPLSIRHLKNLERLSLRGCRRAPSISCVSFFRSMVPLRKTPNSITPLLASFSGLHSLKFLTLSECNLSEGAIPNDIGSLYSLQELDLANNNICSLPSSICCLPLLQVLRLNSCTKLQSLPELPSSLKRLYADNCTSMESLSNLGSISSLQWLDLSNNNVSSLPPNFNLLSQLQFLTLSNCTRIQSLPELPSSIKALHADGCTSMERLSNISNFKYLQTMMLNNCNKLIEVQGLERLESKPTIHMERCISLANTFKKSLFQGMFERGIFDIFLPGNEIPKWFSYQSRGCSIYFEVPLLRGCEIEGLIICVVYAANEESDATMAGPEAIFSDRSKGLEWSYDPRINGISITREDHMWVSKIPHTVFDNQLEGGDQVHVSIELEKPVQVKKCGIHLVYNSSESASTSNSQPMLWNLGGLDVLREAVK